MSGQQPQPHPTYGQPPPAYSRPMPPYPPSGGRGKGGWIVVAVVAAIGVLAGGTFAGLKLLGGSDDPNSSSDDPTSPDPTTDPASTDPWGSLATDAEIDAVSDAVTAEGYACYDSLGSPVLVRRCFLEPATDKYDEQTVTIQADSDGAVNAVDVEIDYFNGKGRSGPMLVRTLRALTGIVVDRSEAAQIVQAQRPGSHSTVSLAWGRAELFTAERARAYHLELLADGARSVAPPAGDTRVGITDVERHYSADGFACQVESRLNTLRCSRRVGGGALTVLAFDECLNSGPRYDAICRGHRVQSLTAAAEFDAGMPERAYTKFLDDFLLPTMNLAADDAGFADEVATSIDDWTTPHRLDVDGLHVEVMPGYGALVGGFDQAIEVSVEGINLTA
jgi:hypothetical protein